MEEELIRRADSSMMREELRGTCWLSAGNRPGGKLGRRPAGGNGGAGSPFGAPDFDPAAVWLVLSRVPVYRRET